MGLVHEVEPQRGRVAALASRVHAEGVERIVVVQVDDLAEEEGSAAG
jgi:hypothetical protein